MHFSIKNTLPLWILFFSCFFLSGAEAAEEGTYLTECKFWVKEDCIKIKIGFPEGTFANSTLYKINNPDPKSVSVRIKNDQLECLETFYQLVDIEVHAVPSHEQGGVTFKIIENLERIPDDKKILKDSRAYSTKYFLKTDEQVNFRNNVIPMLTYSEKSPDINYLRFYTKP